MNTSFDELVGEDLSGVTFVRDYLQLQFNPPLVLSVYTPVTVKSKGVEARSGQEGFANLLIAQINKFVAEVEFREEDALRLAFDDASSIAISLHHEHYIGPEAINLICKDGGWVVV